MRRVRNSSCNNNCAIKSDSRENAILNVVNNIEYRIFTETVVVTVFNICVLIACFI